MFRKKSPLDDVLIRWPTRDVFTVRDMLRSCEVKGITGSGKSSGPRRLFQRVLAAHPRATMTIIAQKPEEREEVIEDFARAGKLDKLVIIDKDAHFRCNYMGEVSKTGDSIEVVNYLRVQSEIINGGGNGGGEKNAQFWRKSEDRMNFAGVEALRIAGEAVSAPNLLDFYTTAPRDPKIFSDDAPVKMRQAYANGYYQQVMSQAKKNIAQADKSMAARIMRGNWKVVEAYWTEFMYMHHELRGNFEAGVMNVLTSALTGLGHIITSTDTNVNPAVMEAGYSVLLDFPYSEWGPTGQYIAGGWKYLTQKYILKRHWKPSGFFNVMILDEFQESISDFDPLYLAQCRSHGGSMLTLTQTVHSEYTSAGGAHAAHHKIDALNANFGTHIYNLSDPDTAQKACGLLGTRREMFVSGSVTESDPWDVMSGRGKANMSFSEQYQPVLRETALMHDMRTGGADNGNTVDGWVIRLGRPFANGENYLKVAFKQG